MSKIIIEKWEFKAKQDSNNIVIPDGCRDVIFWKEKNNSLRVFITSLDETSYFASIKKGDYLKGFRLAPGAKISEQKLLASFTNSYKAQIDIIDRIENFTSLDKNIKQILDCLALEANSVNQATKILGVSTKTLQRKICKNTLRTPSAWISLARVRKAARLALNSTNLAQTACECAYSDQSHMNREFKRWLNITPAKIYKNQDIIRQLKNIAYH